MANNIEPLITVHKKLLAFVDIEVISLMHGKIRTFPGLKNLALFFFAKSTKTYRAINQLCGNGIGYGEDATILARSLLENLINFSYIVNPKDKKEQEHRAELFANWLILDLKQRIDSKETAKSTKEQLVKYFNEYESLGIDYEKMRELHQDECAKINKCDGKKKTSSWSGRSLGSMAKEVEKSFPTTKLFSTYYNEAYRLHSKIAHPDPGGSNSYIEKREPEGGLVIYAIPNSHSIREALCSSFEYYSKLLLLISDVFDLNLTKINDIANEYLAAVKEAYNDD